MLKFLANKGRNWAVGKQKKDLSEFLSRLKVMDSSEIGMVVVLATHLRHQLEAEGYMLLDPINYTASNLESIQKLSRITAQMQKEDRFETSGMMVWVHTLRAGAALELRGLGREMWEELERGFPHVKENAIYVAELTGVTPNIEGSGSIPIGLTPEPL